MHVSNIDLLAETSVFIFSHKYLINTKLVIKFFNLCLFKL